MNVAAIQRAGKAIAVVQRVCQLYEQHPQSNHHPIPSFEDDFTNQGVDCLEEEENFFMTLCNRQHKSFKFLEFTKLEEKVISQLFQDTRAHNISQHLHPWTTTYIVFLNI